MKNLLKSMAIATLFILSSCGSDDDNKIITTINSRLLSFTGVETPYIDNSTDYRFDIDITNSKMSLDLYVKVKFNDAMTPLEFNFKDVNITLSSSSVYTFTLSQATPLDNSSKGYSNYMVKNMKGTIDQTNSLYYIRYDVVNTDTGETTPVFSTSRRFFSTLADGSNNYFNELTGELEPTTTFCVYTFNSDNKTVDIDMYNVKFAPKMPIQMRIRIPAVPATLAYGTINLEAEEIVPYAYSTLDKATPMDSRTVTALTSTLDYRNGEFQLEFNCMGQHFNNTVVDDVNPNGCTATLLHLK